MSNAVQANPRYFYSEYVNHMLRFFMTTPETLNVGGLKTVDVQNWLAVQAVWSELSDKDKDMLRSLYTTRKPYAESVTDYAKANSISPNAVWQSVVRISNKIARQRGLI